MFVNSDKKELNNMGKLNENENINMNISNNNSDNDSVDSNDNTSKSDSQEETTGDFDPVKYFTNKEFRYYVLIDKYFKSCHKEKITKMVDIINSDCEISLRILDWFVTKYSRKRNRESIGKTDEVFDIHISYKAQLKSFKKKYFDPFRRRQKFYYEYDKDDKTKKIYTTLGQLNFFKWAISNNIIDEVEKNVKSISQSMNVCNKEDKKKKEIKKTIKNKNEINKNSQKNNINVQATKTISNNEVNIILNFN